MHQALCVKLKYLSRVTSTRQHSHTVLYHGRSIASIKYRCLSPPTQHKEFAHEKALCCRKDLPCAERILRTTGRAWAPSRHKSSHDNANFAIVIIHSATNLIKRRCTIDVTNRRLLGVRGTRTTRKERFSSTPTFETDRKP